MKWPSGGGNTETDTLCDGGRSVAVAATATVVVSVCVLGFSHRRTRDDELGVSSCFFSSP